ncbi:MAG TPA: ROK family protein [Trueperaceae bacterium]
MTIDTMLAIDIGGTKLAVALVKGAKVLSYSRVATPASDGPEAVLASTVVAGQQLVSEAGVVPAAIGVACAGVVAAGRVRAMSRDLLPGWEDFPLVERLERHFNLQVAALNDAQAAAFGEWLYGSGGARSSLFFVTVSTGVGGGLVVGNQPWRGSSGLAGHIGHVRGGVLEKVASGTALAKRAAEAGHPLDASRVIDAAQVGEPWARELLDQAAQALAAVLADVKLLIDPEVVVLGGGVGLNPAFRDVVNTTLSSHHGSLGLEVVAAKLGSHAGLVGAAALAGRKPAGLLLKGE